MKRIAILAARCLGSFALAQEAKKPAPEMKQLDYFTGTWKCDGKALASPMGPEHPMKTTATGKTDLDGFWVIVRIEEKKTKESPMPIKGNFSMTYDAALKKFQGVWVDNFGGWGPSSSTGWEGDKITFAGEAYMMGQKMGSRDTFTKKGEKELLHTADMQVGGKWTPMLEETCKK